MRTVLTLAAVLALSATAAVAKAPTCRDAKGHYIKCPTPAAAPMGSHCRDKTTKKFAKCSAPNTEPVPMKH